MTDDKALVDRLLNVFNDAPEIALWFEPGGELHDYKMSETRTYILGMWETMQEAAHRIKAQADTVTQAVANERAKIVAWVRALSPLAQGIAIAIEKGKHLNMPPPTN